jgi:hypothetical protein
VLLWRYCQFGYTFRRIYLGEGRRWTILESGDYYRLKHFRWWLYGNGSNFYAARSMITKGMKTKIVFMHRQIMNEPVGLVVDHRNCTSLDNRKSNLRFATHAENICNRRKQKNTSSRFIGVYFDRQRNKWVGRITHNRKKIWLGRFDSEIEAARAYDEGARKYHGEFARLNFPPESEESRAIFARIGKLLGQVERVLRISDFGLRI